jgi:hypothetical protein
MTDTEPVTSAQPQPVVVALPAEIDMVNADSVAGSSRQSSPVVLGSSSPT